MPCKFRLRPLTSLFRVASYFQGVAPVIIRLLPPNRPVKLYILVSVPCSCPAIQWASLKPVVTGTYAEVASLYAAIFVVLTPSLSTILAVLDSIAGESRAIVAKNVQLSLTSLIRTLRIAIIGLNITFMITEPMHVISRDIPMATKSEQSWMKETSKVLQAFRLQTIKMSKRGNANSFSASQGTSACFYSV